MPMTDAPNFVAKFGWRKPCPRYIGPLLRTASVASVGRGDHTLPPQILAQNLAGGSHTPGAPRRQAAQPPVGGGLRPAPLEEVPSCANSRWFRNTTPYRVGADLCVRPDTPFCGTRPRADTQVGPYRFYCNLHQPPKTGRGQRPAPTVDECPMPVQDLPGHPHPRLPQTKTPGMTAGTKASLFRPPSQRPPQARSEAPVLLSSPVPFGIVSKGRAAALPLVVSRRVWEGNSKSLPESFLGSARGYSFDSKRISSRKPPTFVGSPSTQGVALPRHAGSSCPTGCSCQGTPSAS